MHWKTFTTEEEEFYFALRFSRERDTHCVAVLFGEETKLRLNGEVFSPTGLRGFLELEELDSSSRARYYSVDQLIETSASADGPRTAAFHFAGVPATGWSANVLEKPDGLPVIQNLCRVKQCFLYGEFSVHLKNYAFTIAFLPTGPKDGFGGILLAHSHIGLQQMRAIANLLEKKGDARHAE